MLEEAGVPVRERIFISKKAHLILPTHRIIDAASENAKGANKIGSTLKGIGPAYMDKTGRNGLRTGDLLAPDFEDRYLALKQKHISFLKQFDFQYNPRENETEWMEATQYMKGFKFIDGEYAVNQYLQESKRILAEGAQGSLLDVDFGSYPFVTSSNTICAGACIGLGVAPSSIGKVSGIFKAYCTRVGSGPFPTELHDSTGDLLRKMGAEFGATTGRPRRTGWLDLVALKYAVMINGVDNLIMMKADVLDTFETIKIATHYKVDGITSETVPYDTYASIEPVYKEFKGWKRDLTKVKKEEDLPFEFMSYVRFIEKEVGVPVSIISLGPDREQTIIR
jgi:adenylosuccinate synthase